MKKSKFPKILKSNESLGFIAFFLINLNLQGQIEGEEGIAMDEMGLHYIIDGGDTIFIDAPDTSFEMLHLAEPINYSIEVKLSSNIADIDEGLFGLNIAEMFTEKHQPAGTYGADQWQALSDLAPKVIRIPSGGASTLMHLLHHPTLDSDDNGENDLSQGYGFVVEEIVNYFDYADLEWDAPLIADILAEDDKIDAQNIWGDPLSGWIEDEGLAGQCFDFVQSYKQQLLLPAGTRYVDDFIDLVEKIENENTELEVQVIVCLNIVSETAQEGKAIVEYLRNSALNGEYNVNVYGVEMGNECYNINPFYNKVMGFKNFDDYYYYLMGEDVPGFDVDAVLRDDMEDEGHAFLQTFKNDIAFNCKVGIVGFDRPDPDDDSYVLRGIDEDMVLVGPDWNVLLPMHYNDLIAIEGTPFSRKAFDAVILHPYYGAKNFRHEIIDLNYLQQSYDCAVGPVWNFAAYDTRLQTGYDFMTGKFISLFRTGYKDSFVRWSDDLGFNASPPAKELWITEWNYKDKADVDPLDINRMAAFSNSFLQGMMNFEFNLKNIKINFDPDFHNHFMPFATFHNYGGGGNSEMLSFAEEQELVYYNLYPTADMTVDFCDPAYWPGVGVPPLRQYYLKHTPY